MPRGGRRPGAGRPPEGVEGRVLRITLTPEDWARVEASIGRLEEASIPRSRIFGHLLLAGVRSLEPAPWWVRLWRCLRGS
ncbi:MAG: hypothetical protein ACK4G4_10150 [Thermus sp.]|uniref:hypothetical protein n=1 Tax=Thermus sp. TaxID=275 RepID=UPI0039194463